MQPSRHLLLLLLACTIGAAGLAYGMGMGMGHHGGPGGTGGGMGGAGGMHGPGGMMGPPPSAGENPLPASDEVIAKGKAAYEANCSVCHGAQGLGDGPAAASLNPRPPDLHGPSSAWSDGQIAAQILAGRGTMPPFRAALDDEALWSLVTYVRRLQGR